MSTIDFSANSAQPTILERVKQFIAQSKEKRKANLYKQLQEEAVRRYDVTQRENTTYLNINGTLLPIDHLNDHQKALDFLRETYILEGMK